MKLWCESAESGFAFGLLVTLVGNLAIGEVMIIQTIQKQL